MHDQTEKIPLQQCNVIDFGDVEWSKTSLEERLVDIEGKFYDAIHLDSNALGESTMGEFDLSQTDKLLTTTRAVRKRLDLKREVKPEIITDCLRIAIQAPSGSNTQGWRWLVITDEEKRKNIAAIYRRAAESYLTSGLAEQVPVPQQAQMARIVDSAIYLMEHLAEVPVHVIACIRLEEGEEPSMETGSNIYPAIWNFQLALRSRGLGSVPTTLHLELEGETAALFNIPGGVKQAALLPVAYYTGESFKPANRRPVEEITYWNEWE